MTAVPGAVSKSLTILSTLERREPNQFSMVKLGTFSVVFFVRKQTHPVCAPLNRSLFFFKLLFPLSGCGGERAEGEWRGCLFSQEPGRASPGELRMGGNGFLLFLRPCWKEVPIPAGLTGW